LALDVAPPDPVTTPSGVHRRRAVVLLTVAAFQFWMWGTRLVNLVRDPTDRSAGFVGIHLVLFAVGIATGVVLAALGARMWQESRTGSRLVSRSVVRSGRSG
jgi:hypothetical protein